MIDSQPSHSTRVLTTSCQSRSAAALGLVALLALSTPTRGALAQSGVSNQAAAEGLFDQGRELMKKGDFKNACSYLERSQQLEPAVGTLLYLAECYERAGRNASAWTKFREAADAARAIGQSERQRVAEERAARLAPGLSRLVVEVPDAVRSLPGLVIKNQGQPLPAPAWDVAVPVDPGQYHIEASAPGHQSFSGTVQVVGDASTAHFAIPPLTPIESRANTPSSLPEPRREPATAPPPPQRPARAVPAQSRTNPQRVVSYFVAGAGVVGLGLGTAFGLRAMSKNDDAEKLCPRSPECDEERGVTLTDDAKSAATISNVAFAVGGAALAGGIILFLTAPDSKTESPRVGARIAPSGVWLDGTF